MKEGGRYAVYPIKKPVKSNYMMLDDDVGLKTSSRNRDDLRRYSPFDFGYRCRAEILSGFRCCC